nr:MAG TPA: hypothetical protein [Caudoviricetes sp.]
MASTPKQRFYVPATTQAPATASDMARMASEIENRVVMFFPDVAGRDAAVPAGARKAGMVCYVGVLGYHQTVLVDGGDWVRLAQPPESFAGGEVMFWGSSPPAGTFVVRRRTHQIQTTNPNGDFQVHFEAGITAGIQCVLVTSGDVGADTFLVLGMANAQIANMRAMKGGQPVANTPIRIMAEAIGW